MKDKKIIWAWAIGTLIFALIAGAWIWRLPQTLAAAAGKDLSLAAIFSSYGEAKRDLGPSLAEVNARLDENMKKFNDALASQAAKDQAMSALKQDLAEQAAKQKIKAAMEQDASPSKNP